MADFKHTNDSSFSLGLFIGMFIGAIEVALVHWLFNLYTS